MALTQAERGKRWRERNIEVRRVRERELYYANHDSVLAAKRKWKAANKDKTRLQSTYPKARFNVLVRNSRARGHVVSITIDEWLQIVSEPCFYCGGSLPPSGCGIDRIDSNIGYANGNCRPCCDDCNKAKRLMTEEQFKVWVLRVSAHWAMKAA